MRNSRRISILLIAAALVFATPVAVFAEPATPAEETTTAREPAPEPAPTSSTDEEKYAAREAGSGATADFKGGDAVVIGSTALVIILLVVLILVLV